MKKLLFGLVFGLSACMPVVAAPPTTTVGTTIPATTSTSPATTTTTRPVPTSTTSTSTTVPSGSFVLAPSGGDDTANLIAAVAAHSTVFVNQPLKIENIAKFATSNRTLTFQGNGKLVRTTINAARVWQVVILDHVTNFTINNLQILGPDPCQIFSGISGVPYDATKEAQHGIEIDGGANITLNGGNIAQMPGDGIYIDGQTNVANISNMDISCVARTSITNLGSNNVTVTGGAYGPSTWWNFNVELQGGTVTHYHINNPTLRYSTRQWLYAACPFGGSYSDVVVNHPIYTATASTLGIEADCGPVTVIP